MGKTPENLMLVAVAKPKQICKNILAEYRFLSLKLKIREKEKYMKPEEVKLTQLANCAG